MKYSVKIDKGISALSYYLNKVIEEIEAVWGWDIRINVSIDVRMIDDCEIYFNFDIYNQIIEICNRPTCDDCTSLNAVIKLINDLG